jgi:hypothetical protein
MPSVLTQSVIGATRGIPRDGDGDGLIFDSTPREQAVPRSPGFPRGRLPRMRPAVDAPAVRRQIYDRVLAAARVIPPVSNQRHTLSLEKVAYEGPTEFPISEWKQAILAGRSLGARLRGDWVLRDNTTGAEVARRRSTVATVPYLTDHGTFIQNGSEYTLGHQLRLRPGVFTRRQANGELEAHVNVMPGKGLSHRIYLEPETGVFRLKVGQSRMALLPLLRTMGATDHRLREAWGSELYHDNQLKDDPTVVGKLHARLVRKPSPEKTPEQEVREAFESMPLDPAVTRRTLGSPHDRVDLDTLLATTGKLVAINRGEAEPDDRDHLAYMTIHGPEDLLAERTGRDRMLLGKVLWKASMTGGLKHVPPELLTRGIQAAIMSSGLGQPTESINPSMLFDQQARVSRLGEGGIPSLDSVPPEARNVQPSHFAFIDPLVTPESLKAGVDSRLTHAVRKGDDGRLYAAFRNVRTGQTEWLSAQDLDDRTVAFPGELRKLEPYVNALVSGRAKAVPRNQVDYELPEMEDAFSSISNMVPIKSTVKGQREVMAGRMITQALPVVDPEAPLVQSGVPGSQGDSYESLYGRQLGALRADSDGVVERVDGDRIVLRGPDGRTHDHQLYNNYPYNRKTFLHQTPVVRVGDHVRAGTLLARSNYTDGRGVSALGKNARVAYVPFRGLNFEDAIVVSDSFARRMTSEHMYQHSLPLDEGVRANKKAHLSIFPGKYDRRTLETLDDDGVVRPGTTVEYGHPLVLAVKQRDRSHGTLHRGRDASWVDKSETWAHHSPGVVTDVEKTPTGIVVSVKSTNPTEVGDKLCFDPETKLLTRDGWKFVADISMVDEIATLNPITDELEYQRPIAVHRYQHDGQMYYLNTKHINMLVTTNHHLWVARPGHPYSAVRADEFYASKGEWQFKKDCKWSGVERQVMAFDAFPRRDDRVQYLSTIPMDLWLEFLGYYLAEGRTCRTTNGGYQVQISQFRESTGWQKIDDNLKAIGLRFCYSASSNRFEINSQWLYSLLDPLGDAYTKRVPAYVQDLSARQLRVFLDAYMVGDGYSPESACWEYGSSSPLLAEDIQVICLKLGWSVTIRRQDRVDNWQKQPHWRGRINKHHLRPWWKKSRAKTYPSNVEELRHYSGDVHCVTVPNHVVYCKREDKTYWSHNSGRYG